MPVAQASLQELAYNIDAAEEGYLVALKLAPSDFNVVEPLVALQERMRRFEAGEALIEAFLERATDTTATEGALESGKRGLRPDDISVLYVEPTDENGSRVIELAVTPDGDFITPWPGGFFAERTRELF